MEVGVAVIPNISRLVEQLQSPSHSESGMIHPAKLEGKATKSFMTY